MTSFFKDLHEKLFKDRQRVIMVLMIIFTVILILRLFILQILHGKDYQDSYNLLVERKETIEASRGRIFDRNGKLLAYNDLSYDVTIQDSYSNYSSKDRNKYLNRELAQIIPEIEKNGDKIADDDFDIQRNTDGSFVFTVSGTAQQRFRADIFGHAKISDLDYKNKDGINEVQASAEDIMNYLMGSKCYNISGKYNDDLRFKIAVLRYKIGLNSYQKYVTTAIASNVSQATIAYVKENKASYPGIDIHENIIRKYTDSEAFASILGYTGKISTSEYQDLKKKDKSITMNDVVGKSGIEQYMDSTLRGSKGSDTLYVDNVGNIIKKVNHIDSKAGSDVYLSIDYDLQVRTYKLLEKEIAGVLISKLVNQRTVPVTTDTSNMTVAVYDAYIALINNGVIDSDHFKDSNASDLEKTVYAAFQQKQGEALNMLSDALLNGTTPFGKLDDEMENYQNFVIRYLKSQKILNTDKIDTSDATYKSWAAGTLSIHDYLKYCIEKNWIDTDSIKTSQKYVDTDELYQALVSNLSDAFQTNADFSKLVYKYAILQDRIQPGQVCALLYDQGILAKDDNSRNALAGGSMNAYNFIIDKIRNMQITPGQLGLDPCSGSTVVLDTNKGSVLACVSYPGYDNNRLANTVDSKYYAYLNSNSSRPLFNFATQQKTAPGSTFKPMTSTAGMAENAITPTSTIDCTGVFTKVSNHPVCWIYGMYHGTHGTLNVSEALKNSCNYFFYEVGWRLAGGDNNYNDSVGIQKIQKYAHMYGLDEKTGLEIEEAKSTIATKYPVMAAIGQSDNNLTTVALARYAAALATRGKVYHLSLLDHTQSPQGKILKSYGSSLQNTIDVLDSSQWDAIQNGMRMVIQSTKAYDNFPIEVSGKTGTAQEAQDRPPHALFIAYAPSSSPQYALATRIANGYSSHNASDVAKDILGCLFQVPSSIEAADNSGAPTASTEPITD